jgi:SAM-dependent methyltransferase
MSSPRSFDRLAGVYRALEYLAFGRDLERARFAHLDRLRACRAILVTGEGDGRCLERLTQAAPHARIDSLDLSPAMLARASARLAGRPEAARVTFRRADLLTAPLPAAQYDAVVTHFFLDCFSPPQAADVMARLKHSLRPGALWLWADFALPPAGWARLRARAWVAMLYAFFRWQTGVAARDLPPADDFFHSHGFAIEAECCWQRGLVRSVAWRCPAPSGRSR